MSAVRTTRSGVAELVGALRRLASASVPLSVRTVGALIAVFAALAGVASEADDARDRQVVSFQPGGGAPGVGQPIDDAFASVGLIADRSEVARTYDGEYVATHEKGACCAHAFWFAPEAGVDGVEVEARLANVPFGNVSLHLRAFGVGGARLGEAVSEFEGVRLRWGRSVDALVRAEEWQTLQVRSDAPIALIVVSHADSPTPIWLRSIALLHAAVPPDGFTAADVPTEALPAVEFAPPPEIELTGDFASGATDVRVQEVAGADGERSFPDTAPVLAGWVESADGLARVAIEYALPDGSQEEFVLCEDCDPGEDGRWTFAHPFFQDIEPIDGTTAAVLVATGGNGVQSSVDVEASVAIELVPPPETPIEAQPPQTTTPTDGASPGAEVTDSPIPGGGGDDPRPSVLGELIGWLGDPGNGLPLIGWILGAIAVAVTTLVLLRVLKPADPRAQRRLLGQHVRVVVGHDPGVQSGVPVDDPQQSRTSSIRLAPRTGTWQHGPITDHGGPS